MSVRLWPDQRSQLEREARAAFPRECCGLIEGKRHGEHVEIVALHPCRNLADRDDAFEIDPADHFRLMRRLRGSDHEIIGCYHSHLTGNPEPSPRDLASASEEGFVWLIVAAGDDVPRIGTYVYNDGRLAPVSISTVE